MFTILSIGVVELVVVALLWVTTLFLSVTKSRHASLSFRLSAAMTLACCITHADIVSSVILATLFLLSYNLGSKQRSPNVAAL